MEPDTYRRRRVMALIAGLGLIGLFAWAFAGGGGKPATPSAGSSRTYHLVPAAPALGSPSLGSTASRSALALGRAPASGSAASRSAASSSSARPLASGLPSPWATPAASPSGSAAPLTPAGLCAPGTVVLSVFSSRPSYSGAQDPRFAVYAVSTGALPCTFDLGPGTLHLEVMSSGRIIWDSGDCARSDSTWTARLRRGIPVLESITWNRSITLPGCVTLASSARAGTYQAQAWTTSVTSAVLSFRLEP